MKLWTYPGSARAGKALIAAEYAGVKISCPPFTMGTTNKTPEFLAINPFGKVCAAAAGGRGSASVSDAAPAGCKGSATALFLNLTPPAAFAGGCRAAARGSPRVAGVGCASCEGVCGGGERRARQPPCAQA